MADLGDLSNFLKEGSVADLDWLEVDEKKYRAEDKLPEQNLDIAPDLQAVWDHKDKPSSSYFVPNKDKVPALADLSQAHSKQAAEATEQLVKVARYSLMQSTNLGQMRQAIVSRFDSGVITNAKTSLASVLRERGLLGHYYVSASDFTDCAQGSKKAVAFVRRYASTAKFVVAKEQCSGCVHNSGSTCGVFQKQIVMEVPYTPELADAVERSQTSKGKQLQASADADPRTRIQSAYLAKDVKIAGPAETPKPIVNPAHQLREAKAPGKVHLPVLQTEAQRILAAEQAWQPNTASGKTAGIKTSQDKKAYEVTAILRREMLKGRGEAELLHALKLSFTVDDLKATKEAWVPLLKEAGLYGTVYATQESFDDCTVGADFLAKHNPAIKAMVSGGKCNGCIYNKMARCLMYGRPLVASADAVFTPETVKQVIWEHRLAGKLETGSDKIVWADTPKEALKAIYRTASQAGKTDTPARSYVEQAFRGANHAHVTAGLTKREILRTAARYLNEGLYGQDLASALKRQFDPRDIVASAPELKTVVAEQGLQGIHYVDPMVYEDYAKGCEEGARLHRARLVPYVKMGSKCTSCVLQTKVGYCSKYNKELVKEPPYTDKKAQQQEILNSGKATEINLASLVNNSKSIVAEFGMKSSIDIDLNPEPEKPAPVQVELGGVKFDL